MENLGISVSDRRIEKRISICRGFDYKVDRLVPGTLIGGLGCGQYLDLSLNGFSAVTMNPIDKGNLVIIGEEGKDEKHVFVVKWVVKSGELFRFGCKALT